MIDYEELVRLAAIGPTDEADVKAAARIMAKQGERLNEMFRRADPNFNQEEVEYLFNKWVKPLLVLQTKMGRAHKEFLEGKSEEPLLGLRTDLEQARQEFFEAIWRAKEST